MDRIEERVFMWTIVWNAGERQKEKKGQMKMQKKKKKKKKKIIEIWKELVD